MTAQTRAVLKALYEDGDKPTGSNYSDLMDSFVSIADTTVQTITSDLTAPKFIATTEVSSPLIVTTEVSASIGNFTIINADNVSASVGTFTDISASSASFTGPVRVGLADKGFVVLTQQVTLVGGGKMTAAVLPAGADVLGVQMFIKTTFATALTDINVNVGTSALDNQYGTFTNVSALGHYQLGTFTSAATNWTGLTGTDLVIHADVTAVSGAVASTGEAILSIIYVQK